MSKAQWIKEHLKDGEKYAGIILNPEGRDYHLILLPGEIGSADWNESVEWAIKIGGELPTRREQSLLFANLKGEFEPRWYWSGEQFAPFTDYAWDQNFYLGHQGTSHKSRAACARAVRRIPIE